MSKQVEINGADKTDGRFFLAARPERTGKGLCASKEVALHHIFVFYL